MDLGYDIALALPGLRAQAESRMTDTCIVHGPDESVWNADRLDYDAVPAVIYEGRCRVRFFDGVGVDRRQAGSQLFMEQLATLSLPFSVPESANVQAGHTVTITGSQRDPALVGTVYTVDATRSQTDATARRFPIKETNR